MTASWPPQALRSMAKRLDQLARNKAIAADAADLLEKHSPDGACADLAAGYRADAQVLAEAAGVCRAVAKTTNRRSTGG